MHVAFKGLIAEDYLRNLSLKTKRGVRANAERGLATGARLFGYRSRPGGEMEIVAAEAEIVRHVFDRYVAGDTAREIAARLNLRGVPGPRGGQWNASSIHGSRQRGNGILRTELYAGVKVWNRMEVVKDPFTGRRSPKMKPEAEWRRTEVPQLRIVDQAVWDKAACRKERESAMLPRELVKRRVGLFSGLLKCGLCGGSYTAASKGRLACATHRERGDTACANSRTLNRAEVEERVVVGLRTRLLTPALVALYLEAYRHEWAAQRAADIAERAPIEKRLAEIERAEARTLDAIERGVATTAMEARMMEREVERQRLRAQLDAMEKPAPVVELHPAAVTSFADKIGRVHQALVSAAGVADQDAIDAELVASVRELVDRIEITPLLARHGTPYDVTVKGRLTAFLKSPAGETATQPPNLMGAMVAGGGIEPPTCGL